MSFSSEVKKELYFINDNNICCKIAELTAIFNGCGQVFIKDKSVIINLKTENKDLSNKIFKLLKQIFNFDLIKNLKAIENTQLKF
jgi:cell division protein WhiA